MYFNFLTNLLKKSATKGASLIAITLLFLGSACITQKSSTEGGLIIYDRNQKELYRITTTSEGPEPSILTEPILASTLTAEDGRFFEHNGIDFVAWLRVLGEHIGKNPTTTGGSTITQQVARANLGINRPRNIFNKIADIALATYIEKAYEKEAIINHYLHTTDYGNTRIGISAASQYYFGTSTENISWQQASLLAALVKNATQLNPHNNLSQLLKRQRYIANAMEKKHIISAEENSVIQSSSPKLQPPENVITAPHFVHFVIRELEKEFGTNFWEQKNVKVTTTLDLSMYENARSITQQELTKLHEKNANNSASIIINNTTGEILSYIGNNNFFDTEHSGEVDMIQALRQPGSALKPFIYLTSIMNGWGTGTIIYDIPSRFLTASNTPYTPLNYDLKFHGPVTMRSALANSYNVAAVKALEFVGIPKAKNILQQFGITSLVAENDFYGLSLALGSGEVSLFELSNAYRILAQEGKASRPVFIKEIQINDKKTPWKKIESKTSPSSSLKAATSMITDILSDNQARTPQFEEHNDLAFTFPVAAKTGTSRNFNDNWTLGFSNNYTIGVWVGNTDGTPMKQVSGIAGAGPIFQRLMKTFDHQGTFTLDPSVEKVTICLPSGLLTSRLCTNTVQELFLPNTGPKESDNWYQTDGLHMPPELSSWADQFTSNIKLSTGLIILSPQDRDIFQLDKEVPMDQQNIPCRITTSQLNNITITLNQKIISRSSDCNLPKTPGNYTLEIAGTTTTGEIKTHSVHYKIQE